MRRGDSDQHADLADSEPSKPMDDGYIADLKLSQCLICQCLHLVERHLFVGFIIQVQSLAPRV